MKSRAERAEEQLAEIIRTGKEVSPRKYRKLVKRAGLETTEDLRQQGEDRATGTVRGTIDYINNVPAFMYREDSNG